MKKFLPFTLLVTVLIFLLSFKSASYSDKTAKEKRQDSITFLFLGDIMEHDREIRSMYNYQTKSYSFAEQFVHLKDLFSKYDVVVGNLEVTFAGKPYRGYPRFSAPEQLAADIKQAGINVLAMANNHINDYYKSGVIKTVAQVDKQKIHRTGAFISQNDKQVHNPLYIRKGNIKVALLNYTYGVNVQDIQEPIQINIIDTNVIKRDLRKAQNDSADAVIIFMHWGQEYKVLPNTMQKRVADFCFRNGADVIIGAHPHVIQPMEYKTISYRGKNKKIFLAYSLGNYVSDYWRRQCEGGALVSFTIKKSANKTEVLNPRYHLVWVYKPAKGKTTKHYYPLTPQSINFIKEPYYKSRMQAFLDTTRIFLAKYNINVPEAEKY